MGDITVGLATGLASQVRLPFWSSVPRKAITPFPTLSPLSRKSLCGTLFRITTGKVHIRVLTRLQFSLISLPSLSKHKKQKSFIACGRSVLKRPSAENRITYEVQASPGWKSQSICGHLLRLICKPPKGYHRQKHSSFLFSFIHSSYKI